jgi:hypothetical protein
MPAAERIRFLKKDEVYALKENEVSTVNCHQPRKNDYVLKGD